jgi:hypothetical protein
VNDLQNSAQKLARAFLKGIMPSFFGDLIA